MRPTLTPAIIHAAATDAGNRCMRSRYLRKWDEQAYNASVAESNRLYEIYDKTARKAATT